MRESRITRLILPLSAATLLACAPRSSQQATYFPDGTRRWEYRLVDGAMEGPTTTWHPNGQVAMTGAYQAGAQHGLFTRFDDSGAVVRKELYAEGELLWSGGPSEDVPNALVEVAHDEEAHDHVPSVSFNTLGPNAAQSGVTFESQMHVRDRNVLSSSLAGSHRFGSVVALASVRLARVEDSMLPSGTKSWLALGAGYMALESEEVSLVLSSKVAFPSSGDDIGGFAAASRTYYGGLAESASGEPKSAWGQIMASASRVRGARSTRIDLAITPVWAVSSEEPRPARDFQLIAHLGVGLGLKVGDFTFSVDLAAASKLVGALDETPVLGTAGLGLSFDKLGILRPKIGVAMPVDEAIGDVIVFTLGSFVPTKAATDE